MPELFVSYSRDDADRVMPLVENLRKLGFDLWIDIEHLKPGTPAWTRAIDEALLRVDGVLGFLSPSAKVSKWCTIETMRAETYEKPLYPILLSGDAKTAIPIHLTGAQYADLRARVDREAHFDDLVQTLARDFNHALPSFDLDTEANDDDAMPTIQNVISGHVEGHVYILNVGGDADDINMAGGDIVQRAEQQAPTPQKPSFDALAVYRQAAEARQKGEHGQAVKLLSDLQHHAPDLFPDSVQRLIDDSEAEIEREARTREYRRAYEYVSLLTLDPLTHDDARHLWDELKATYPNIDDDPDGLADILKATRVEVVQHTTVDVTDILPPPFDWCEIPAGRVTIAGGYKMHDYKQTFDVQPFWMAKYPITYAQYQVFVEADDGFTNAQWWEGLAASDKHRAQPGEQHWKIDNHPRENASWYDAVAFCRWLSHRTGYEVRLPTEWEWQWAAQGDTGWAYPYGPEFDKSKANTRESGHKQTTPVDHYPQGASPFGVLDMSSNVWEWCLNEYHTPENVSLSGEAHRVVRGGSWNLSQTYARVSYRLRNYPSNRLNFYGFRVCVSAPIKR